MTEWEWIVCKGCNKTGWLDLNQPMNLSGWEHKYFLNKKDENVNFYLCCDCGCRECSDAYFTTGYNEDGSTYPDLECQVYEGICKYLQSFDTSAKEEET